MFKIDLNKGANAKSALAASSGFNCTAEIFAPYMVRNSDVHNFHYTPYLPTISAYKNFSLLFVGRKAMEINMKINVTSLHACGMCLAPYDWNTQSVPRPYRLYFIKDGSAFFHLGDEEFPLKKDHFYLFPSSLPFLIRQDSDNRLDHLFYDFIMSPPMVAPEPICCGLHEHPLFAPLLTVMQESVCDFAYNKNAAVKDTMIAALEAFLTLLFSVKPFPSAFDSTILKSVEYIESHYREPITIQELAANVYLNEDYFIRKFKKSMGMTPYAYLSRLRRSIAAELISGGTPLAQAASEVGFLHPSSLCHSLKKTRIPKDNNASK